MTSEPTFERNDPQNEIFTYPGLQAFLAYWSREVAIFPLRDWHGQSGIILRHAVDLDILPARRLAELEAEVGVRSTFFFLVSGHTYNPASIQNRPHLRALVNLGFEIGLHFDPTLYGSGEND